MTKKNSRRTATVIAKQNKKSVCFTDRYSALGFAPNLKAMCAGPCEGIGVVPIRRDEKDPFYKILWARAERKEKSEDGWHFVTCLDCGGTGVKRRKK